MDNKVELSSFFTPDELENINGHNEEGKTPLHRALEDDGLPASAVAELIKLGADVNLRTGDAEVKNPFDELEELEGYAERCKLSTLSFWFSLLPSTDCPITSDQDEFCIPEGSENEEWFKALDYRLRLNRAGFSSRKMPRDKFVEGLNSVSDHVGCLYHILRHYPQYVEGDNHRNIRPVSVS